MDRTRADASPSPERVTTSENAAAGGEESDGDDRTRSAGHGDVIRLVGLATPSHRTAARADDLAAGSFTSGIAGSRMPADIPLRGNPSFADRQRLR